MMLSSTGWEIELHKWKNCRSIQECPGSWLFIPPCLALHGEECQLFTVIPLPYAFLWGEENAQRF